METNRKRIGIYCRVSTDDQAINGYSLRDQERRIRQYLELFDDKYNQETELYIDDGYSAKSLDRKDMQRLLNDIQENKIDTVVIHNLDRLTRNIKDLITLVELFEEYDVRLISIREKIETSDPTGMLFISIIVLFAQWERETTSLRTKRAIDQAILEGKWVHGLTPVGFESIDGYLSIVDKEAEVVREIFEMYLMEEFNVRSISIIYNAKNKLNKEWTNEIIRGILRNRIYIGEYIGKRVTNLNHSPSIIDRSYFYSVQRKLDDNAKIRKYPYLFRDKCYNAYTLQKFEQKSTKKPNSIYLYYVDPTDKIRINENMIYEQLEPFIDKHINLTIMKYVKKEVFKHKDNDYLIKLHTHLHDSGFIDSDYFTDAIEQIEQTTEKLVDLMNRTISRINSWKQMTGKERKKFIALHIDRILINPNEKKVLEIEFNQLTLW
ncbi:recombinase family protein [Erysipelothrix aquatica]|uniref:recombinase family protein n=1 Tax=Erysipelothrix aquatica TaxID=2683714 RepID=UPI0013571E32|nr:recombinase family protein [Erysipelothrix aquatica]